MLGLPPAYADVDPTCDTRAMPITLRPATADDLPFVRGLYLDRRLLVHSVPMNHMSNLETGKMYFAYSLELIVNIISLEVLLSTNVSENPIASAFSDIERLAGSGVD